VYLYLFLLFVSMLALKWKRHCLPRFKKALHRTTTLTLPGSSDAGAGAIMGYGSAAAARKDGAEAVLYMVE
jgi:hypothetical protein